MDDVRSEPTRAILEAVTRELADFAMKCFRGEHKRNFLEEMASDLNRSLAKNYRFKNKKQVYEKVDFSAWSNYFERSTVLDESFEPKKRARLRSDLRSLRDNRNFWAHPTAIPYTSREFRVIVHTANSVLNAIGSKDNIKQIVAVESAKEGVSKSEFDALENVMKQVLLDTAKMEEDMARMKGGIKNEVKAELLEELRAELKHEETSRADSIPTQTTDSEYIPPRFWNIERVSAITTQDERLDMPPPPQPIHPQVDSGFAYSAKSLQDYAECARRFELRYIMRLRYPALEVKQALEQEMRLRRGNRFHKLVQQRLQGVPAELLTQSLADDADLSRWWETCLRRGLADLPPERHAEITLQTTLAGQRLVAKYDLLALRPGEEAVIVDWKTGARVPSGTHLRGRMQTVVYRYTLAQAGAHLYGGEPIPPERIRMDYLYVALGGQRVSLEYSAAQMRDDEARLLEMIAAIGAATEFPLTEDERRCKFCTYRAFCGRGEAGDLQEFVEADETEEDESIELDFDQIAEIEF